jgi:hypothetical protein
MAGLYQYSSPRRRTARAHNPVPRPFGRHKLKAIVFEIEDAEFGRHFFIQGFDPTEEAAFVSFTSATLRRAE